MIKTFIAGMTTRTMQWRSRRQLQQRLWERGEFYKEIMPEPGVRKLLGHTLRRVARGTWKYSARWVIENHPGFQYNVFTDKSHAAAQLWNEHQKLVRAVNDIEDEKYEKQKRP